MSREQRINQLKDNLKGYFEAGTIELICELLLNIENSSSSGDFIPLTGTEEKQTSYWRY